MPALALLGHQFRFEWKLFWRNPASVAFSVALPLAFLFLLGAVFGEGAERDPTYGLLTDQYLVPAVMTLGIVSASFVNVVMTLTFQREQGSLKRLRGTPLPTGIFVAARTLSAVVNSLVIALVILLAGHLTYGVPVDAARLLDSVVVCIVASAALCGLGFALSVVIPSQSAAPAITNLVTLPLYFISGVFGDAASLPATLAWIGRLFPIEHIGAALFSVFSPKSSGVAAFDLLDLAIVVGWGVAGALFASWKFHWEPRSGN